MAHFITSWWLPTMISYFFYFGLIFHQTNYFSPKPQHQQMFYHSELLFIFYLMQLVWFDWQSVHSIEHILYKLRAVQRRACSLLEGVLHRGAHHHYVRGTPSVQTRVWSTDWSHHQYSGGCAIRISYTISKDEGVQCSTTKTAQEVIDGCI